MTSIPQGSAQAVQIKLEQHQADAVAHITANEREGWNNKADRAAGAIPGNLAALDEVGNPVDSGLAPEDINTRVPSPTEGNLVGMDAAGKLTNSNIAADDVLLTSDLVAHNVAEDAHADIRTALSDKANLSGGAAFTDNVTLNGQQIVTANEVLSERKTIYVAKIGSDTIGDGSSTKPFLTIQKAVNEAVQYFALQSYGVTISVGPGTYMENVSVAGPQLPNIIFSGAGAESTTIQGVSDENTLGLSYGNFTIDGFTLKRGTGQTCLRTAFANIHIRNVVFEGPGNSIICSAITSTANSIIGVATESVTNATFNNWYRCINLTGSCIATCGNLGGSGNSGVYCATMGAIITHSAKNPSGTTLEIKAIGGQIFS